MPVPPAARRHFLLLSLNGCLLVLPALWLAVSLPIRPAAPWAPVFGLLLSLLCWLLVLLLARRWRTFFLLQLPLLALAPVFVWYVLKFGAPPGEGAVAVALTSSLREAWSFVDLFELRRPVIAWLAALALYLAAALALGRQLISPRLRRGAGYAAVPLLALALFMPSRVKDGIEFDIGANISGYLTASYPFGSVFSAVGGLLGNLEVWGFGEERPRFDARPVARGGAPETHILVIGETARADRFGLYGYARPTTPRLATVEGLIAYDRAFSTGNLTMLALPMLMTGTTPRDYAEARSRGNLIDLAREAGLHTSLVTNQDLWIYKMFHPRPDQWRQAADIFGTDDQVAAPDSLLLAPLDDVLRTERPKRFVVVHTYGSHWDYMQRLPDDGFVFSGRDRASVRRAVEANREGPVIDDLYDDTILQTDKLLAAIIARAARLPGQVTVTYISDHGEALPGVEGALTHGFETFHLSELHVPLLFWGNAAFRHANPARWALLNEHRDRIVSQDALFYTLAATMGIEFPAHDPQRDLGAAGFRAPRLDELRFRIGSSRQLRSLAEAADWSRSCARVGGC